ncbi:MAG: di-trans,poly-cis-decaprenylcistransferase [Bdellovibrionales bacterium]|nr:di-trans,poly-cis-decaprenylcistransferase [Bdellovibrionales bacterium]
MRSLHVAIIMDGNGRWARSRGHARYFGHVRGVQRVREVVDEACRLGIGALTLYAFSTENWKRPEDERAVLWKLLHRYIRVEVPELKKRGVRFRVIGDRTQLTSELKKQISAAENELSGGVGLQLTLAISYGARDEIVRAAKKFASDCLDGVCSPESINENFFSRYLDTEFLGSITDVDVVLRTSGEQRLSNFLLWQSAYAEMIFVEKPWPEFRAADFREALDKFSRRHRRFGSTEEVVPQPEMTGVALVEALE